ARLPGTLHRAPTVLVPNWVDPLVADDVVQSEEWRHVLVWLPLAGGPDRGLAHRRVGRGRIELGAIRRLRGHIAGGRLRGARRAAGVERVGVGRELLHGQGDGLLPALVAQVSLGQARSGAEADGDAAAEVRQGEGSLP